MAQDYIVTNSNADLVDAPFAKMAVFMINKLPTLGFPPEPISSKTKSSNLHRQAAELLDLIQGDSEYVAAKIRHLDFIARNSRLADRFTWRSTLKDTWNEVRIFDKPSGFFYTSSTPKVTFSGLRYSNNIDNKLQWNYSISATSNSTVSTFTIRDSNDQVSQINININSNATIVLSDAGYNLLIQNNLNANEGMTGTITIRQPYKMDLIALKDLITQNTDFLTQLTVNDPDLLKYLQPDSSVEDAVAAFLLAVSSI